MAFAAAAACKEKYGELRCNNANRIVVGEFVRSFLRDNYPDLRVVDRVKHATYAIELALIPTEFAAAARDFSNDSLIQKLRSGSAAVR